MTETYKVVKIVSEKRIVVNAPSARVCRGDVLEVFKVGDEVIDPDTGKSLGTLDYIKARVVVVDVYPNMCTCRNEKTTISNPVALLSEALARETIDPLNVNAEDISGVSGADLKISIGDLVRKALG